MARRKRKNTTEEEQQLIRQSNQNGQDGGSKAAVNGPLAPAQLQQLQTWPLGLISMEMAR